MIWIRHVMIGVMLALAILTAQVGSAGKAPAFRLSKDEEKLVDLINQERKKEDLAPLKPNPKLFEAARVHSANMARQKKMEHVLDGKTPFDRIKKAGYLYQYAGENIAAGDAPMEDIVKAWMESPLHRKNIMGKDFTETGVGLVPDDKGAIYYTQVFGKPFKK